MKKKASQANEEIFNSLAKNMQDGVLVNLEGKHVFINDSLAKMLGYDKAEDLIGGSTKNLVHPGELEKVLSRFKARQNGEKVENQYETVFITKTGSPLNVEINAGTTLWQGKKAGLVTVRNIETRKQVEQELQNLKTTLDQTLDCIFMFECKQLRFIYINEGAINQVGYTRDEMFNMTPYDIKPNYTESEFRSFLEPLINGTQRTLNFETVHQHKDGHCLPVEIFLQLIKLNNKYEHYVAIVRDITERKKVDAELEKHRNHLQELVIERTVDLENARDEAEQANIAKSEFLSQMSHELRTPMNAILGFAQVLEMEFEKCSDDQQLYIKEILNAGNHLMDLINEILDLAKIESGKLDVVMESIDVTKLLQQCIALITPQANARPVDIINNIDDASYIVNGDFTRLKQVFLNLLSNAVKYNSKKGHIMLDAKLINKQILRVSVTDTGDGITEDNIKKLFISFERLNKVSNIEGTGIGLTISRYLIELMGGNVGVESTVGIGSTFWIELKVS